MIYFSNNIDQRLYRQDAGRPPSPITPAPAGAAADAFRYADGVIDRRRGRIVCVREDHTGGGEAITTLVAVDLSSATATQVLVSGNDFYSTPRLSPDGNRMSWLTWRHPDMPWVATEALGRGHRPGWDHRKSAPSKAGRQGGRQYSAGMVA